MAGPPGAQAVAERMGAQSNGIARLSKPPRYVDVVDRPRRAGVSNYGMWDRLWIGILDLVGVWWLIRRRRRVPQATERR
jgi:hypothetical protein